LYWELQGSGNYGNTTGSKSLVEGGLEYYSDSSIAPYLRSTAVSTNGGYVTMNNNSVRYVCGSTFAIWHGATADGFTTFTEVGMVPTTIDPETEWVNSQDVSLINASWLFFAAPGDYTGSGIDRAGVNTPCLQCSISQVTSIAQNGTSTYNNDGSYFGVDNYGDNAINWLQEGMGEWGSNCVNGTSLCTFYVSSDPLVYYGGPQYYPNSTVSGSDFGPSGYGAYETYDGIAVGGSGYNANGPRPAEKGYREPLPPASPAPVSVWPGQITYPARYNNLTNCSSNQAKVPNDSNTVDQVSTAYSSDAKFVQTTLTTDANGCELINGAVDNAVQSVSVRIHESNYSGGFTATASGCGGNLSPISVTGTGPNAFISMHGVAGITSVTQCAVVVTDSHGRAANVYITLRPGS
jgi:hypothetical protein